MIEQKEDIKKTLIIEEAVFRVARLFKDISNTKKKQIRRVLTSMLENHKIAFEKKGAAE